MSILDDVKLPCGEENLLSFIAKPFAELRFAEPIASAGNFTKTKRVNQANFQKDFQRDVRPWTLVIVERSEFCSERSNHHDVFFFS